MSRGRIRVIDSDSASLTRTISSLAEEGFEVSGAASDAQPLSQLENGDADLVLLVLRSPGQAADPNPTAVAVWKPRGTSNPIGMICPSAPFVVSVLNWSRTLSDATQKLKQLRLSHREEETAGLSDVAGVLRSRLDPAQTVPTLVQKLAFLTGADDIYLLLKEGEAGPLAIKHAFNRQGNSVTAVPMKMANQAVEKAAAVLCLKRGEAPPELQQEMAERGVTSAMAHPVGLGDRTRGVLCMTLRGEGREFSRYHAQIASILSSFLALTLESAEMAAESEKGRTLAEKVQSLLDQRQQETKALNNLLQKQQSRLLKADEECQRQAASQAVLLRSLAEMAEQERPELKGHSAAVARWAQALARALALPSEGVVEAAYLHHLGALKIAAQAVLPDLPEEERTKLSGQPNLLSARLAEALKLPDPVVLALRHLRENWDGSGYPNRLMGEQIPPAARLLRVAEAYVEPAPSPNGKGGAKASPVAHLRERSGKEYDARMVEALLNLPEVRQAHPAVETISTVSHELRSPLTYLMGYSELLSANPDLPPSAQKAAQEIHEEAEHMSHIVEDLLEISRFELGKIALKKKPADLVELAAHAAAAARMRTSVHTIEPPSTPGPLVAEVDVNRVRQVLDNLLSNAINYSPDGGPIKVQVRQGDAEAIVSISDSGIGIPADKAEVIFEKFQRLDSPLKDKVKGTGIGLNLSKLIVQGHGGRIWVESTEGKGSTFYFTLPLRGQQT